MSEAEGLPPGIGYWLHLKELRMPVMLPFPTIIALSRMEPCENEECTNPHCVVVRGCARFVELEVAEGRISKAYAESPAEPGAMGCMYVNGDGELVLEEHGPGEAVYPDNDDAAEDPEDE